ncbi:membrane protein [Azorhizobium oxalatiphilum]|uniref:Membrane protein n=1 Tax=Azorhizobium oxalatiphilum TaxID=980631 RepID=A0A917FMG6_9HYPH|nr:DMT family transporter [Azorhizobium oxalatiphilum]GGF89812.1 membrane protein [Azorhizobium oxalatiphilum]
MAQTQTVTAVPASGVWMAVPLMLGATLCLTTLDTLLKMLAVHYPIGPLVFFRNVVQVVVLASIARAFVPTALRTRQPGVHLARGACLMTMTVLITLSLSHLPMAQTYALTFSAPLMATVLALLFLGERPLPAQWLCIAAGFAGVLIALDPGGVLSLALLFPLAQAAANAVFYVLTRYAGRTESAMTLVLWAGIGAVVFGVFALVAYVPMPLEAWAMICAGGLLGTSGQLMMAAAFRRAPTAVAAPLVYAQMVWAMLIGWLMFDEVPGWSAILGAAIVAASGIGVVRFGRGR